MIALGGFCCCNGSLFDSFGSSGSFGSFGVLVKSEGFGGNSGRDIGGLGYSLRLNELGIGVWMDGSGVLSALSVRQILCKGTLLAYSYYFV